MQMRAVREPALRRELGDLGERGVEHGLVGPELELPHPGRVEQKRTARQRDELPVRGRMSAASLLTRLRSLEDLGSRKPVDQRGLADTGRAEQCDRAPASEIRLELLHPFSSRRTDRVNRDAERDRLDLGEVLGRVQRRVVLVYDDYRVGAAVPRRREVQLQTARVEVLPERRDEEDGVDVGRYHLRDGAPPCLFPCERRPAGENRFHDPLPLAFETPDRDPVSRHRQVEPFELSGGQAAYAPVLGEELARAVMPRGDARGDETFLFVGPERIREERVPAEIFELQRDSFGLRNEKAPEWARTVSLRSGRGLAQPTGGSADARIGHLRTSFRREFSAYRIARAPQGPVLPFLG